MAILNIRIDGDPVLRRKCDPVDKIDSGILKIIEDMAETVVENNGAAIAAPQVGVLKRIVVINFGEKYLPLINPEIIEVKGSHEVIEGCLSIPGKWGKIERPEFVKVEALNLQGEKFQISGENDLAKCFCHEIDHLEGILFTDKIIEFVDL